MARHLVENGGDFKDFLSSNFIYLNNSFTEMVFGLAVTALPFEAPKIKQLLVEEKQTITSSEKCFLFCKEIKEGEKQLKEDIIINQRFFDPNDRYLYDEEDASKRHEKEVKEFITGKVYGCKVVVINSSIATQSLQLLYEIPEGAVPVSQLEYTKS